MFSVPDSIEKTGRRVGRGRGALSLPTTVFASRTTCPLSHQSCQTLCNPLDCSPPGSSVHGVFSGKNTGMGCHFLLQGIFLTQGSNPHLLHCRRFLYHSTTRETKAFRTQCLCGLPHLENWIQTHLLGDQKAPHSVTALLAILRGQFVCLSLFHRSTTGVCWSRGCLF